MEVKQWFNLPERNGIAAFAQAQVHLYRHNASLQDYFLPLQLNLGKNSPAGTPPQSFSTRVLSVAHLGGYKIGRHLMRRKYKADVLFCPMPYFQRQKENQFLIRSLLGVAQSGATILCLLSDSAPCRGELVARLKAEGRLAQVTLIDPVASLNPLVAKLLSRVARIRGQSVFNEITEVLKPHELAPPQDSRSAFEHIALFVEAWNCLSDHIEFDAVVTRCHWHALCSPVCRTARQRNKPVVTFQQGVIGHTLDVPVTASKYVAFGNSSAAFLSRMNRSFFQAVGKPEPTTSFIPSGCLFDTVLELPNQFVKRTLLIIDEPPDLNEFYGVEDQRRTLFLLTEKLLQLGLAQQRIVIRPHPYWDSLGLDLWKDLIRQYPNQCELSHIAWTLEDDLNRSSVVVGVSSGALTVASAAGLPTFFLETKSGYATGDLACFRSGQTFLPDDLFREISRVLTDVHAYAEARASTLRNAQEYYANGTNLNLNGAFFERMLRPEPIPAPSGGTASQ